MPSQEPVKGAGKSKAPDDRWEQLVLRQQDEADGILGDDGWSPVALMEDVLDSLGYNRR